jgi:mono/diheme cytochrome c family protein
MNRSWSVVAITAALVTGLAPVVRSQQSAAPPLAQQGRGAGAAIDPAAAARGLQTFTQNCAACHGANGRGGGAEGATDLSQSAIALADDAKTLGDFLKVGRPERRMPNFALSDAEVGDLSAFLRATLSAAGRGAAGRGTIVAAVVGDARAGEAYFSGAGRCTTCHSVTGDLKGIGARLTPAAIQGRVVMPRGSGGYPRSFSAPPDPNELPRTVTITQPSGEVVSGTLLWITDFNVTLVDGSGVRRTVARNGDVPKVEVKDPLQFHIDHMKTLTDKDMHDLTAYLVTVK